MRKVIFIASCMVFWAVAAQAAVQFNKHVDVTLNDGTVVRCFPEAVYTPPKTPGGAAAKPPGWDKKVKYPDWVDRMQSTEQQQGIWGRLAQKKKGAGKEPPKLDPKLAKLKAAATDIRSFSTTNFYYLPMEPHVSHTKEGDPNFSMVRFVTDKSAKDGGAEGAIIHFLVEYGLSPQQKAELEQKLKKMDKSAKLKGAVPLEQGGEGGSTFTIVSATLGDKGFTSNLVTSGKAPVMEGQKAAAAARLDQYGATLLQKTLEMPTTDISVTFDLKYVAVLPAYDIDVIIDYSQYHLIQEELETGKSTSKQRSHYWNPKWYNPFNIGTSTKTVVSQYELQNMMDALTETGVVTIQYNQYVPDADKEIVDAGLFQIIISSFFDMQKRLGGADAAMDMGDADQDKDKKDDGKPKGANYKYYEMKRKQISKTSKQILHLSKSMAVYQSHTMTGNVGAWYDKYKDNPKCFASVNLDDPFFQRRELRFVIDNAAYDIFGNVFNYATVKVRKKRASGPAFEDEFTIDKKYLEEHGQTAVLTFARMGEKDSDIFEYATQWSVRGGKVYPAQPQWKKGDVMAVTLAAPIEPLSVEVETDLNEMQEQGYTRAAVQFRYTKFGKLFEDPEMASISAGKGEPIVKQTVFHDVDRPGLEYRTFFYHKQKGKVPAAGWQRVEGDYIYCPLPQSAVEKAVRGLL